MSKLINPQETIKVIQSNDFKFQKRFGQNFLIDESVLSNIITSSNITKDDCVLEIGPGIGTMTQALAEAAGHVITVEIDANLIPILHETLKDYSNVTVIHSDVLKLDLNELIATYNSGKPIKVVANLPYYITTPIIMGLFESSAPLHSITVMVQKEVADRMQSGPGTKDYGALSLAVQYYSDPYIVQLVPPNCFIPRPNVGSAVIRLTRHSDSPVKVINDRWMFKLIKAAFGQRRKTLLNSLFSGASVPKEDTLTALRDMGLSETVRGEALTLSQFASLSDLLINYCSD
ncbi:dimethyladenosine transferase [Lachnospiraceae bacterium JC7]|nr:dimethyladenosine transferase [Lachnospiraceae bacterium JC7]